ncbi:MAG TPA: amino acid adenylation domain-containing protein [Micromonosporaceae bacterium]|nr:amino acid adenylation domain-containing protein [Micromonosporaceae bacterium]
MPDARLQRLVEEVAHRAPTRPAVECDGVITSYGELDALANGYAHALVDRGAAPGAIVAVGMPRSAELVGAVLGTLKAGCAFLPLDITVPALRLAQIVEDAAPAAHLDGTAPVTPAQRPPHGVVEPEIAYCVYTSGSTGRPKGALLTHAGLRVVTLAQRECLGAGPDDRVAQFASPGFDAFVFELVMALANGATLVVVPDHVRGDPQALLSFMDKAQISFTVLPSLVVAGLSRLPAASPRLRLVASAGDVLPASAVRAWPHPARLFNLYGPTEATIWSTVHACDPADPAPTVPIGHAIPGVDVRLLGDDGAQVSQGEICVLGPTVGHGYLNRPELTAERFRPAGTYRTGDIGRRRADGAIEFLGRHDRQVKLRGYRIELAEIEAVLRAHAEVDDAVVLAQGEGADRVLVAYVVAPHRRPGLAAALHTHLAERLPDYLVPARLHPLASFPVTSSGKADREALAALAVNRAEAGVPRTPQQEAVARIWCETLGVAGCGVEATFHECGGHSLTATQLANRVNRELGTRVTAIDLLNGATIATIAARVPLRTPTVAAAHAPSRAASEPASTAQMQIAYATNVAGDPHAYVARARLTLRGPLDVAALTGALRAVVARHEIFRTRFELRDGELTQVVEDTTEAAVECVAPGSRSEESLLEAMAADVLDAAKLPLVRWALLRYAPDHHVLLHVEHHYVHDGWSFRVFLRELAALYSGAVTGNPAPIGEPVQFGDYTRWQRAWLRSPQAVELERVWRQRLSGVPLRLRLPALEPSVSLPGRGELLRFAVDPELLRDLGRYAARQGLTVFQAMFGSFALVLARLSARSDLVLGTSAANRSRLEWEQVIGLVVNVVPVRVTADARDGVGVVLAAARRGLLDALRDSELPFSRIVAATPPDQRLGQHPVAQVLFNAHSSLTSAVEFAGLRVDVEEALANGLAKFPLNVTMIPDAAWAHGEMLVECDLGHYDPGRVERFALAYLDVLAAVAHDADITTIDGLIEARLPGSIAADAPAGATEALLASVWRKLLGLEIVGRGSDFFALGGNPVLAQRMVARVNDELDAGLTVGDVVAHPTLADLARRVVDLQLAEFDPDELSALLAAAKESPDERA